MSPAQETRMNSRRSAPCASGFLFAFRVDTDEALDCPASPKRLLPPSRFPAKCKRTQRQSEHQKKHAPARRPPAVAVQWRVHQQIAYRLDDWSDRLMIGNRLQPVRHRLRRHERTRQIGKKKQGVRMNRQKDPRISGTILTSGWNAFLMESNIISKQKCRANVTERQSGKKKEGDVSETESFTHEQ